MQRNKSFGILPLLLLTRFCLCFSREFEMTKKRTRVIWDWRHPWLWTEPGLGLDVSGPSLCLWGQFRHFDCRLPLNCQNMQLGLRLSASLRWSLVRVFDPPAAKGSDQKNGSLQRLELPSEDLWPRISNLVCCQSLLCCIFGKRKLEKAKNFQCCILLLWRKMIFFLAGLDCPEYE